jgi:hypothetical protein
MADAAGATVGPVAVDARGHSDAIVVITRIIVVITGNG